MKNSRFDPGSAMVIASVATGVLQSLSSTPSWRESFYTKAMQQANQLGRKLNAKREALIMSFEKAYNELSTKHNLQSINFQNASASELNKAMEAFDKYGNTELVKKYDKLNTEFNDYVKTYKTQLDSMISKISGGKVQSLSILAKNHNDKVDDMIAKWSNDWDKHEKDISSKISTQREKDTISFDSKRQQTSQHFKDEINKAESDLVSKQNSESNKLQQDKYNKYNTLANAVESANKLIDKIESEASKNSTKWYDHILDFVGNILPSGSTPGITGNDKTNNLAMGIMPSKTDKDNIEQGVNLDVEFKV